ncbi:cobaltochelatase subunit CobN [Tepidiforma sp.]|uniref:cobaltochelatase subunit CobN n=1 Tax=Tepidiforma sp. TaxID=2682230 RepID=UPI002ADD354C|nr:cobaltochelatase subunit CobN [Tepidiforma sp.]
MAGRIVLVTSHDADLAAWERLRSGWPVDAPAVEVVGMGRSGDAGLCDRLLAGAAAVVLRLLGGREMAPELVDGLAAGCRERGIPLLACRTFPPVDDDLSRISTIGAEERAEVWEYFRQGGAENLARALRLLAHRYTGAATPVEPPLPMPEHGIYDPLTRGISNRASLSLRWHPERPLVAVVFYRTHLLAGDTDAIDALCAAVEEAGANVLPVFTTGLLRKDGEADATLALRELLLAGGPGPDCVVSLLSFAATRGGRSAGPAAEGLGFCGVTVLEGVVSLERAVTWEGNPRGLNGTDLAIHVALPEVDGVMLGGLAGFREPGEGDTPAKTGVLPDRTASVARLAVRHALLRRKPNAEKRVAIFLNSPNGRNARLGSAFGLDALESTVRLLRALQRAGYRVDEVPADGQELLERIVGRCSNELAEETPERWAQAPGKVAVPRYAAWLDGVAGAAREAVLRQWGEPPGEPLTGADMLPVPGALFGNIWVGPQPQRGFGFDPGAIFHSPDLPPPHQHLGVYRWLIEEFRADALVDMGKHGNLEWLPGKSVGLSAACFPEVAQEQLPLVYPFIVNNPGEGTQAKRRAHAVIVDHLVPPMAASGVYGPLAETLAAARAVLERGPGPGFEAAAVRLRELCLATGLDHDPAVGPPPNDDGLGEFAGRVARYLSELETAQIPVGLHILGQAPEGQALAELVACMGRVRTTDRPSLHEVLAEEAGLSWRELLAKRELAVDGPAGQRLMAGEAAATIERLAVCAVARAAQLDADIPAPTGWDHLLERDRTRETAVSLAAEVVPALRRCVGETEAVVAALEGRFVPPGPAGSPTRGQLEVLPTGRNFYGLDPRAIPTRAAWEVGKGLAAAVIAKHLAEEGRYPESVTVVMWGTHLIRTGGEDVAEALTLLGVEPVWDEASGRVTGLRPVPLEELGRPRIDVVARVSGFFRDAFPQVMELLDRAVALAAAQDEPPEANFVRRHLLQGNGEEDGLRIFGPAPGTYVDAVAQLIEHGNWQTRRDLAQAYATWVGHGFRGARYLGPRQEAFARRAAEVDVVVKNRDNEEHDVLDTDDYFQDHGAMVAVVEELGGRSARAWIGESYRPDAPGVRDAKDETKRALRRRVLNPRWQEGMRQHGHAGGSEMVKAVDYLFGYDATAGVADDWDYSALAESLVLDGANRRFLEEMNPWALRDIARRLLEAASRGMWEAPDREILEALERTALEMDGWIEAGVEGVTGDGD